MIPRYRFAILLVSIVCLGGGFALRSHSHQSGGTSQGSQAGTANVNRFTPA